MWNLLEQQQVHTGRTVALLEHIAELAYFFGGRQRIETGIKCTGAK